MRKEITKAKTTYCYSLLPTQAVRGEQEKVRCREQLGGLRNTMSARRHEQQTRTPDSGHGVLAVRLPFCGAGGFETYGGGILVVVEGGAAIPGVSRQICASVL